MVYHIFTDNHDKYVDNLKLAEECFELFVLEYGCARLYEKQNEDDEGNCIKSHGHWPQ